MAGQPARESPPVITICPQCQLSLAVSAADLRIAQGHVRCGRCASVFNALVTLYDTEERLTVYRPAADLMSQRPNNEEREGWSYFVVPLAGSAQWKREGAALATLMVESQVGAQPGSPRR